MDKMQNINHPILGETVNFVDCIVLDDGYCRYDDSWNYLQMTSSFNRLYFVLDGRGMVRNHDSITHLIPGFAYIIPLNTTNDYICESFIEKYYVHFRMELYNYMDVFEIADSCFSGAFDVQRLQELLSRADSADWVSNMAIKAFIIETIAGLSLPLANHLSGKTENALKYKGIFDYVKSNCHIKLDAKEIAHKLKMPLSTMQRNFKKDLGISIKDYIITEILKSAKDKIIITDMQIREIAYTLGFDDEFYFSRYFKKYVGISPVNYRKQNKMMEEGTNKGKNSASVK